MPFKTCWITDVESFYIMTLMPRIPIMIQFHVENLQYFFKMWLNYSSWISNHNQHWLTNIHNMYFFLHFPQIFSIFHDFWVWNASKKMGNLEKSFKIAKIWGKMKKQMNYQHWLTNIGNDLKMNYCMFSY